MSATTEGVKALLANVSRGHRRVGRRAMEDDRRCRSLQLSTDAVPTGFPICSALSSLNPCRIIGREAGFKLATSSLGKGEESEIWYARVDSNHRPFAPEANALSS